MFELESFKVDNTHLNTVKRLVGRARSLLARIDDGTKGAGSSRSSFVDESAALGDDAIACVEEIEWVIDALRPADLESEGAEDVLYFALVELRACLNPIAARAVHDDHVAIRCARLLGTIVRTMVTVERQLCSVFGGDPELGWALEPGVALEVRLSYSALRQSIVVRGRFEAKPTRNAVRDRLKVGLAAIEKLRQTRTWPHFRIADRVEFLRLRDRLQAWLARPDSSTKSGASIWDDLVAFAELLEGINMRQELREVDRWIASEMLPLLEDCDEDDEVPPVVRDLAVELQWRGAAWGALFAEPAPVSQWIEAFEQLVET